MLYGGPYRKCPIVIAVYIGRSYLLSSILLRIFDYFLCLQQRGMDEYSHEKCVH